MLLLLLFVYSVYLDYNATTPLEPEVLDAIHNALGAAWGNPSSSYHAGNMFVYLFLKAIGHFR